jgi:hypothetical protein
LALAYFLSIATAGVSAQTSVPVIVPLGTVIRVYIVGGDTAEQVKPGAVFFAKAAHDVSVGGVVVVLKDATIQGTLISIRYQGRDVLTMRPDWVSATDGSKIPLQKKDPAVTDPWFVNDLLEAFGMAGVSRTFNAYVTGDTPVHGALADGP